MANLQDITNRSEVGTIKPWGKATAPVGYVLCDGAAISRTDYVDLFGVISTTYGAGNGSTTFNVPDLQGKTPQGYDGNTYNLAATGGANTVTVSVTNNQSATNSVTNNQAVSVTGSIDNTSLTTAQLAEHCHCTAGSMNSNHPPGTPTPWSYFSMSNQNVPNKIQGYNYQSCPPLIQKTGDGTGHNHSHTLSGTLTGSVAVATNLGGAVTASGTNTFSPYVVVNYIIKH
jgi:microcystin-dependent protein